MELFLVPNNPERTVLVSPNGVAHYQVKTSKTATLGGRSISRIQRPAESEEDSIVAEIEWKNWATPTVVRSNFLRGMGRGLMAQEFLYKRSQFSSYVSRVITSYELTITFSRSRYFLGNDDQEYRWKVVKGVGFIVRESTTD